MLVRCKRAAQATEEIWVLACLGHDLPLHRDSLPQGNRLGIDLTHHFNSVTLVAFRPTSLGEIDRRELAFVKNIQKAECVAKSELTYRMN